MKPFSFVIDRMRELAAENPDRITKAMYFDSVGDPVCIVGHVLHELGARYEGESVVSADGAHVSASWAQAIHLFWDVLGVHEGTFEQSRWVQNVQTNQDLGYSWSGAICNAHDSALVPA